MIDIISIVRLSLISVLVIVVMKKTAGDNKKGNENGIKG